MAKVNNSVQLKTKAKSTSKYGTSAPSKEDDVVLNIYALIFAHSEIDLSHYKMTTIRRRIERHMHLSKCPTMQDYFEYLRNHPGAVKSLSDDIFIHITEFFRDPAAFQSFRKRALVPLIKNRKGNIPLRFWVPGCSSGEEVYSLAITILEYANQNDRKIPFQIFATDINEQAVQRARGGFYTKAQIKNVSEERLSNFFDEVENGYRVKKYIRDLCVFSRHDLAANPPFAKIDVISCRNVLIYFDSTLQQRVMPIFHYALNTDGILWLGKSESPTNISKLFSLVDKASKIYRRLNVATPIGRFPFRPSTRMAPEAKKVQRPIKSTNDIQKEVDTLLISRFAPPGLRVNKEMEILSFHGKMGDFLEFSPGAPHYNLLKLIRPEFVSYLRLLVQTADRTNKVSKKNGIEVGAGRKRKIVSIEVSPVQIRNPNGSNITEKQFLILFYESRTTSPGEFSRKRAKREIASGEEYVIELLRELDLMRDYQQDMTQGYESTREELTSANEELQSSLEEYQSTNEELETAKEELQASNEELSTVNEELHIRNLELVALNEKLAFNEERFRLLVEGVKDYAIYMMDPKGYITTWNEGGRRLKGYEASEIIGRHFSTFYLQEDIQKNKPALELVIALREGKFEEVGRRVRKDGNTFWANVVITPIYKDGVHLGFSKITRDISERIKADEKLQKSEQRFRQMIEAVKDYAIFQLDPTGAVMTWNEGARRLKGYEASEIVGQHISKFYSEDTKERAIWELTEAARLGRIEDEGWRVRKDGTKFWANVIVTALRDKSDGLVGFTKVTRDLTERKIAQEKLLASHADLENRVRVRTQEIQDALRSRDEFLSIASHELKTPLTSLKLQLQLMQRSYKAESVPSVADARESLSLSLRQIESLTGLVDDLLDISRIQTGHFTLEKTEFNLSDLIHDVVKRFGVQLEQAKCFVEMNLPEVVGVWDRHRLEQVCVNIISNAIKYAPKSVLKIYGQVENNFARLTFEDSGPGISRELHGKVFERFERAHATRNVGGLGLGLFISKRIVEAHEGQIRVESQVGKGAKFFIDLPMQGVVSES